MVRLEAAALALVVLGACGSPVVTDASSSADSRPASSGIIETTLPNPPSLVLSVSNQSFADDPIGIVVTIDGREVVRDQFAVEDQHHWVTYELVFAPGSHAITLESDTGVTRTATFEVAAAKQRWAAISYWYDPPDPARHGRPVVPRSFELVLSDDPIGFA